MPGFFATIKEIIHNNPAIRAIRYTTPLIFSKKNSLKATAGFALAVGEVAFNIMSPYLFSLVVQSITTDEDPDIYGIAFPSMFALVGVYGVAWTVGNLTSQGLNLAVSNIGPNAGKKLTMKYVDHVINQSTIHELRVSTSDHLSQIPKACTSMPNYTARLFTQIFPTTMEVVVASSILSKLYGAPIGIGLASVTLVYTIYDILTKNNVTNSRHEAMNQNVNFYNMIFNMLINYKAIHSYNQMVKERQKLSQAVRNRMMSDSNAGSVVTKLSFGQSIITGAGLLGILLYVTEGVKSGKYTVNDFVFIATYLAQFLGSLTSFGLAVNQNISDLKNLDPIFKELDVPSHIVDNHPNVELVVSKASAEIEFKNIKYHFFNALNFTFKAGKKIGIVGASGSGKSTISTLLQRFDDPMEGQVLINGQDIKMVSLASLRKNIAIVPQKLTVFNDTLLNNITYAKGSDAAENPPYEIDEVLRRVGLDDSFMQKLPHGLDTMIGEHGEVQLSEGEIQRIAIARILFTNPAIIILDEITSALDSNMGKHVQHNLDDIFANTTMLVITHHLSTIENADHIIVLQEGSIAEQGTHSELIAKNGLYAEQWHQQIDEHNNEKNENEHHQNKHKSHRKKPHSSNNHRARLHQPRRDSDNCDGKSEVIIPIMDSSPHSYRG